MDLCLEEKPEATSERLLEALEKAKADVERTVRLMGQRLAKETTEASPESGERAPGEIQACVERTGYVV